MIEEWRDIPDHEGYQVSNFGRIKSLSRSYWIEINKSFANRKEKILKLSVNRQGYLRVCLYKNGNKTTCRVNRLVLSAFVGESDLQGNHIDGNKKNNRLDNLEYCTCSENHKHAFKLGLMDNKGEKSSSAKLNNEIIKNIRENKFNLTRKEFAACYNVSTGNIDKIINNKIWVNV